MALPTSGQIDLNAIHVEAGGTTQTEVSLNDSVVRGLISKDASSQNAFSEYYGASSSAIQSGDAYFILLRYSPPYSQGLPMAIWVGYAVLKLGGTIVKGNFSTASSWNSGQQTTAGAAATWFSNLSYTHTDGNTYVPATAVDPNDNTTWPSQIQSPTFAQSEYTNKGVQLQ